MAETSNGTGDEIPFTRPKTAREEAAALERSKREAEMAELRRLRTEAAQTQQTAALTPAEAARKKREEEMAELRRLKAAENEEMRRKLSEKGGTLTTDMNAFQMGQRGAHQRDRKSKLEAQSGLHGHRGYYETKTAAALDKSKLTEAQKAQMAMMGQLTLDGGNELPPNPEELEAGGVQRPAAVDEARPEPGKLVINEPEVKKEVEPKPEPASSKPRGVMFKQGSDEKIPVQPEPEREEPAPAPKKVSIEEPETERSTAATSAAPEPSPAPAPPAQAAPFTEPDSEPTSSLGLNAPTYTRVDIKFSFGLIVRSSAADGFSDENLRDNETLKKCMEGTSKILREQMPSPPDNSKFNATSATSFKIRAPEAYYDPTLEPTVISIEEDKKNDGKKTAKGNKRTLVKASFPVFLRDEALDEEGERRSARMLKETKSTVFKALRAAVSGGSFLR